MRSRRTFALLRVLVTGTLLAVLVWQAGSAQIWASWANADGSLLALAFVLQLLGVVLSTAKWRLVLHAERSVPSSWLLRSYLAGQFANNFLPTTVGGDALRTVQLGRKIGSYSDAGASVFVERLTGFLVVVLLANAALALAAVGVGELESSFPVAAATAVVSLAALAALSAALLQPPKFARRFTSRLPASLSSRLRSGLTAVRLQFPRDGRLALVMSLALAFQSVWIALHVVCGEALGIEAPLLVYVLLATMTDIVGLAPFFLNNLGARELVFVLYLSQIDVPAAAALAFAFLVFTIRLLVSGLGGLVLLVGGLDAKPAIGRGDALSSER